MSTRYSIVSGNPEADRLEVLAIAARNRGGPPERFERRYTKYYENNPLGPPSVFFARDNGMANWFLSLVRLNSLFGGQDQPLDWRADKWSSWIAIATMVNWKWIGYNALLYLSAMQTIPKDVYEAAAVDGAGPWRQLWRITVPMIQPVVVFTVILSTIGGLQLFNEPMMFDQNPQSASGGSAHQFQTIAQLIYKVGWKDLNLGYAAAMSWALFLIILIVAGINAGLTKRIGGDR